MVWDNLGALEYLNIWIWSNKIEIIIGWFYAVVSDIVIIWSRSDGLNFKLYNRTVTQLLTL
jgi:hypothetical protein